MHSIPKLEERLVTIDIIATSLVFLILASRNGADGSHRHRATARPKRNIGGFPFWGKSTSGSLKRPRPKVAAGGAL